MQWQLYGREWPVGADGESVTADPKAKFV